MAAGGRGGGSGGMRGLYVYLHKLLWEKLKEYRKLYQQKNKAVMLIMSFEKEKRIGAQ